MGTVDLINAIKANRYDDAYALLERGVDPDASANNFIPIIIASQNGRAQMVELLMEYGADIEVRTSKFKQTPRRLPR